MLGAWLFVSLGLVAFALFILVLGAVLVATDTRPADRKRDAEIVKGSLIAIPLAFLWPLGLVGLVGLVVVGIFRSFTKESS